MGRAPISLTMIVRNEESTIGRLLASVRPHVAQIVVIDTGSTDGTAEACHPYIDIFQYYAEANDPETCDDRLCVEARKFSGPRILNFAKARQYALSWASQPWVLWLDADDELRNPDRLGKLLHRVTEIQDSGRGEGKGKGKGLGIGAIQLPYVHEADADVPAHTIKKGDRVLEYSRERIFSRDNYHWIGPVHEVAVPVPNASLQGSIDGSIFKFGVEVVHRKREWKKPAIDSEPCRNLRILEHARNHGGLDARLQFYRAMALDEAGKFEEGKDALVCYAREHGDRAEGVAAALLLVDRALPRVIHEEGSARAEAESEMFQWATIALKNAPLLPEAHFAMGRTHHVSALRLTGNARFERFRSAVISFECGLANISSGQRPLFLAPRERSVRVREYLIQAFSELKQDEDMRCVAREGLLDHPGHPQFLAALSSFPPKDATESAVP